LIGQNRSVFARTARLTAGPAHCRTHEEFPMNKRFLDLIDRTAEILLVGIGAVMTVVVCAQVLLRYGFAGSFDWAEETARLCFVWLIFLAMPLAVKRGIHVSVEIFTNLLPAKAQKVLKRLTLLLSAVLMIIVIYYSIVVLRKTWYEMLLTIDISVGWFTVPVMVGAFHSALHLIDQAIHGLPEKNIVDAEGLE
jgi:TRAP-type C4-dicarboxylate transport system permease small subunit